MQLVVCLHTLLELKKWIYLTKALLLSPRSLRDILLTNLEKDYWSWSSRWRADKC